jgi:N-acetylglutamate synthase-like GNAT family acetyltransferase
MEDIQIRPLQVTDQAWKESMLTQYWGSTTIVRKGEVIDLSSHDGFMVSLGDQPAGFCTFQLFQNKLEITNLVSWIQGKGVGAKLLEGIKNTAIDKNVELIWLVTTNDNVSGLKFYQKNGFHLVALYPNALEKSRQLKPGIPLTGLENIPMRDELELSMTVHTT